MKQSNLIILIIKNVGTWNAAAGEQWNNNTSTLQQLFVSVQSQILIENPYFNEPGYESNYNNAAGLNESKKYNNERRYYTLCHTMYDLLQNPEPYSEFEDVIINHFKLKKNYIIKLCNEWEKDSFGDYKDATVQISNKLKELLHKL